MFDANQYIHSVKDSAPWSKLVTQTFIVDQQITSTDGISSVTMTLLPSSTAVFGPIRLSPFLIITHLLDQKSVLIHTHSTFLLLGIRR